MKLYQRGFLDTKSYLCFAKGAPDDRFRPVASIVGSRNSTRADLTTNQALNLTHKVLSPPEEIEDAAGPAAQPPLRPADGCRWHGGRRATGAQEPGRRAGHPGVDGLERHPLGRIL